MIGGGAPNRSYPAYLTRSTATLAPPGSLAFLKERDIRMTGNADLIEAFRAQALACGKRGSPFMAALLSEAAGEIGRAGSISGLLASASRGRTRMARR